MPAGEGRIIVPAPPSFTQFELGSVEQSIPDRFGRIAAMWPDRLAVKFGPEAWTYADLAGAADRVAAAVTQVLGCRAEAVAVLAAQGPHLFAAILGILKAGHFYVPFDDADPLESNRSALHDCGARLIVCDGAKRHAAGRLLAGVTVVNVEDLPAPDGSTPPAHRDRIHPGALACIYYTSGTTGPRKGVMDTHRNILHNVLRYTNGLRISPGDRLTLVQSPTFSGVMSSQFGALLNGAVICPYDLAKNGIAGIGPWLVREDITIYHSVPAIFRTFLRAASEDQIFRSVRVVRLEGDGAALSDVLLFRRHFGDDAVLAHGLGATECGLVRRYVMTPRTPLDQGTVPIGYPVDGVDVQILGADGREAAPGEIGEIVVESAFISPGYWNRADLTAAVFTPGAAAGTRRYRTGDLGRIGPDGCLEHLGRKDKQPKVRGQRVDVESVEAAIVRTGLVREAVAVIRQSHGGEARVVAYVVPLPDREVRVSSLKRSLTGVLSAHEMPARFVVLDALPVTGSHKIDRDALPLPSRTRPTLDVPFLAPRTDLQRTIASGYADVLGLDAVGIADNFFDLGGDSLDSAVLLAHLGKTLDRDLGALNVFATPTVESLARAIEADGCRRDARLAPDLATPGSPLVRVQSSGSRPPFFFLHAEYGGDGFYCFNVARHLGDDQPFFGLSPFGRDGERVPETIDAMASAYLAVVRGQQPEGPYVLGGFCAGAVVAWEMACQLSDLGVRVSKLVLVEPPSVECGRLTRAAHTAGCVLAKALALSPRGRARMLLRVVRLARLRHLPVTAANLRGLPAAIGRSLVLDAPVGGDRRADIAAHYSRAVSAYIPRPFDGPVLCLQADDEPNKPALAVWRRHSSNLTSRGVPGDHNSCIVTHARALAHALTI